MLQAHKKTENQCDKFNNQQAGRIPRGVTASVVENAFLHNQGFKLSKATLYQDNMSEMLLEKNDRASSLSRTKHIEIRYLFIQDRVEKVDIGLEYCHTDKMVADFMTKPLQGKKFFEFRDCIMGMPNGDNIGKMRKVRDEIAHNEDLQNVQTARRLESKQFKQ